MVISKKQFQNIYDDIIYQTLIKQNDQYFIVSYNSRTKEALVFRGNKNFDITDHVTL